MTPPFHLVETPIEPGITLIEASAGTGKTFTIAGLFLRMIVENRCTVREILVVTFTEAATEELRGRIRQTLFDALTAFTSGKSDDSFLAALLLQHTGRAAVQRRLDAALRGFDEAPIYTIHGFCQRTLKDRAFESGTLFDTELIKDQSRLLQEIADDYWRRNFYTKDPVLLGFALQGGLGPDALLKLLDASVRHPELRFISRAEGMSFEEVKQSLLAEFSRARDLWRADAANIKSHFGDGQTWCNQPYNRGPAMDSLFAGLEECFGDAPASASFEVLTQFATSSLVEKKNKRRKDVTVPTHLFFDACEKLIVHQENYRLALLHDFLRDARVELPKRKQSRKLQSFDDLLSRLRDAVNTRDSEPLVAQLRSRYKAALIDEFQDTDPVQCAIFQRVFAAPPSVLCYIGDPKQAIYGFRGADIFTYLTAKERAKRKFTLTHNWRSESKLVRAVNTLFQRPQRAFVFRGIDFEKVDARGKADETPLTIGGQRPPPLQFWFWRREEDEGSISIGRMEQELPGVVASEIARLIASDAQIGDRPIRPQDIAVLVMTHRQARLVEEALQRLNIPCALHTEASVFHSPEAVELHRVLVAVSRPGNERELKAALATSLCGLTGTELERLSKDEAQWQILSERFHRYHERWIDGGFMAMCREWLQGEHVRRRLLVHPDGERRLTNLLHLAELLHRAELDRRLAPNGLVQWLADLIHADDKPEEEHQIRLERDDNAVRIVTIHKSKGLEYPVVFCPFAWRRSEVQSRGGKETYEEEVCFHRNEPEREFVRDIGSSDFDANKNKAMVENLAENVRLLYVALTRARHRCCVVWGGFSQAESSALAWLLHRPPGEGDDVPLSLPEHFEQLTDVQLRADLQSLARDSLDASGQPAIEVIDLPPAGASRRRFAQTDANELQPRAFTGTIRRDWRIASFSSLAAAQRAEAPDHDAAPVVSEPVKAVVHPAEGIFAFPAGTKAGACLHEIYENLDFTSTDRAEREGLVERTLRAHGFPPKPWSSIVCDAVERSLLVPLEAGHSGFRLSKVSSADRLNELEFYFPVERISADMVRRVFQERVPELPANWLERLNFIPSAGFLKGYIDLVFRFENRFYLVDWKSNRLGYSPADYGQEAMQRVMFDELYVLQYHLYTVALHRYLQLRLPGYNYEQHFGGVRYLFVRGIDPAHPQSGVFSDRPSEQRILELSRRLGGETEVAR